MCVLITVYYTTIHFTVFTCTALYLSCHTSWVSIELWLMYEYSINISYIHLTCHTSSVTIEIQLHCLGFCHCYFHWLISRVLLHYNITAGHTSSPLLIPRLSCEFGMGLWEVVRSYFDFSIMVVGTFHSLQDEDNFWIPMYIQHVRLFTFDCVDIIACCKRKIIII